MILEDFDHRGSEYAGQLARAAGAVAGELARCARRDHDRTGTRDLVTERRRGIARDRGVAERRAVTGIEDDHELLARDSRSQHLRNLTGTDRVHALVAVAAIAAPSRK